MRILIRLGVLALAAVGAKSLYDRFGAHSEGLKQTGREFVDRVGNATGGLTSTITGAKDNVMGTAKEAATDVASAARDTATEVSTAADDARHEAARQLDETDGNASHAAPSS